MSVLVLASQQEKLTDETCIEGAREEGSQSGEKKQTAQNTLHLLLEHFNYLQSTQGNQKKVCGIFYTSCSHVIPFRCFWRCVAGYSQRSLI